MADRVSRKLNRTFDKGLRKELDALGAQTLDVSRGLVPIGTGNLRDSSRISYVPEGWTIIYDVVYATDVEEGSQAGPANYTMKVKRHKRRLASGKVTTVTSHKKQYSNHQRPKQIAEDTWRIITHKTLAGNHFLTDAWRIVRNSVKDKDLRNALPMHLTRRALSTRLGHHTN